MRPHDPRGADPFPKSLEALERALRALGLPTALARPARRSWRIVPTRSSDERIAVGTSKVGGSPDLPRGAGWPESPEGVPLSFLAQVRLADVASDRPGGLPRDGLLSFFYDTVGPQVGVLPTDAGHFAVLYATDGAALVRLEQPRRNGDRVCDELEACTVAFRGHWSIPVDPAVLPDPAAWLRFAEAFNPPHPVSKLLGHPNVIQEAMEGCCELAARGLPCEGPDARLDPASLVAARREWRLLLQLDGEPAAGLGPTFGRVFFWIRTRDLRAPSFDRVWAIRQTT